MLFRLLRIADAAHAMSPIGGISVNVVVEDAIRHGGYPGRAAARRTLTAEHLAQVPKRRTLLMKVIRRNAGARPQRNIIAKLFDAIGR